MPSITRHIRNYFALFSLLIALFSFSSCSGIFGGDEAGSSDGSQKGTVTLNLGGGTLSRITWPPLEDGGLAGSPSRSDLEFEVFFSGVRINATPITGFLGYYSFFVPYGNHDIEVRTFVKPNTPTNSTNYRSHYGTGRIPGINVPGQGSTPVTVTMQQAGTLANPFLIYNEFQLRRVGRGALNPSGFDHWTFGSHYRLAANITITGGDWVPIPGFSGTFNGGGFSISGLTFDTPSFSSPGMFELNIGTIENLNLLGVNFEFTAFIPGTFHFGGVAGTNQGIVRNITVQGSLEFLGFAISWLGGVVGRNELGGIIENSSFTGSVQSSTSTISCAVGGVVGYNGGTVTRSRSSGSVLGENMVGGIVGVNGGLVQNSHSSSDVSGAIQVGGVVGANQGTVQNNYSSGYVSGSLSGILDESIGGVVGESFFGGTVQNNAALNQSITRLSGVNPLFGRVSAFATGVIFNNHARADMVFIDGGITQPDFPIPVVSDPNGMHGADVSPGTLPGQFNNQSFWETTLGWDFTNVWQMQGSPPLPVLRPPP